MSGDPTSLVAVRQAAIGRRASHGRLTVTGMRAVWILSDEKPCADRPTRVGCWLLAVGCWLLQCVRRGRQWSLSGVPISQSSIATSLKYSRLWPDGDRGRVCQSEKLERGRWHWLSM